MKLLVTGGAGFIGSNFVRYLRRFHREVEILVLDKMTYAGNVRNLEGLLGKHVELIFGDIEDRILVDQLASRVDIIINFAAETHNDNSLQIPELFLKSNVNGTFVLLEAAKKYNLRFHQVSTDEVFGDTPLESKEKFGPASAYHPSSPYSASKAAADMLVMGWIRSFGVRATISNCTNNYGPYQHIEKFIPRQITNILLGRSVELYGTGLNVRDWIHVEDHCAALWEILTHGKIGEAYLISSGDELSNLTIAQFILEIMGRQKDDIKYVADRPGHDRRYALDSSKVRADLGWDLVHFDMRKGLKSTVDWYTKNHAWWASAKENVGEAYLD